MSRTGILVLGPAGAGKLTFCTSIISHMQQIGRTAHIVNLDPAAEPTQYEFEIDIRDLVLLQDVMEEMELGPNGGLIYCFEYLMNNLDWLDEQIGDYNDEYLIFDCPGQIELYTHIPILPNLARHLQNHLNFSLCCVYLLEAPFVVDTAKFFSGALSAMSAMILLELPHINVLSKFDLVKDKSRKNLKRYLNPDPLLLAGPADGSAGSAGGSDGARDGGKFGSTGGSDGANSGSAGPGATAAKFARLNQAIAGLVDDFGMVQFLPLDCTKESDSVANILSYIDDVTQWSESQEPKEPHDEEIDEEVEV